MHLPMCKSENSKDEKQFTYTEQKLLVLWSSANDCQRTDPIQGDQEPTKGLLANLTIVASPVFCFHRSFWSGSA